RAQRSLAIKSDPRALRHFLDKSLAVYAASCRTSDSRSGDEWRDRIRELHYHFPLMDHYRVYDNELRAALELATLWIPERGADQVGAAVSYACEFSFRARRLYEAVCGEESRYSPKASPLPWSVLAPLKAWPAWPVREAGAHPQLPV